MKSVTQSKRKEIGQSMIELALTITVLMVLLSGTVDLGHAFFTWLSLRDAAQEGAVFGSYKPSITELTIETYVVSLVKTDVVKDPSANVVADAVFHGSRCLGYHADPESLNKPNYIEVNVEYTNFPITMPFLGALIGNQIPIRATIKDNIIAPVCN